MVGGLTHDSPLLIPLEERAENIQPSIIRQMGSIDERAIFKVSDYSTNSLKHPLFMMGPKGYGKTFAILKSLNRLILEYPKFLPVMFVYKKSRVFELLPPTFIAEPESWGERLSLFDSDIKTLVERANLIVMDDLHYRCEAIIDGEASLTIFIDDLKLILEFVEAGKKVLLVSESPLAYYGDLIQDEELDEVLAQYGQTPYRRLVGRNKIRTRGVLSMLSSFEIPKINYASWSNLFVTYGFDAEDAVRQIIYNICDRPRFFIRVMQFFTENRGASVPVTIEDLVRVAIERGVEPSALENPIVRTGDVWRKGILMKSMEEVNKRLYLAIINSPFHKSMKDEEDALTFINDHYELIETVCKHVRDRIGMPPLLKPRQKTLWRNPFYAMRILEADDPDKVEKTLEVALDLHVEVSRPPRNYVPFGVGEDYMRGQVVIQEEKERARRERELKEEIRKLATYCYRTPVMSYFRLYYYRSEYEKIPETNTSSWDQWDWWRWRRFSGKNYVKHSYLDNIYLLLRPFEKAFQDLTEKHQLLPTLKVPDRRYRRLFTDQQLIDLHAQGLNDREIGEKLETSTMTVNVHRRRIGLKSQYRRRLFTDQQFIELYEQGFNDREIAEKLGAANSTVNRHRRRLGLKAHSVRALKNP